MKGKFMKLEIEQNMGNFFFEARRRLVKSGKFIVQPGTLSASYVVIDPGVSLLRHSIKLKFN